MLINHLLLAVFWTVYCVLHSVMAGITIKEKLKNVLGKKFIYYRLFYTVFALVTLVWIFLFQLSIDSPLLFQTSTILRIAGYIIATIGLLIMLVCIKGYFMSLSGLKSLFQATATNTLIISGIHKYVRHPLYLGTFTFIWGLLVIFPYLSLLIANVVITVYTTIAIKFEEDKLILEFGDAYKKYQESVPKLIPRL
ncbi:MAG TPA: isoprenylcysteine carboxylmethyltransferase family protein [Flavisolibacter sp.]|nr:isoprenylcysteine carboxylmethyltransferase family protein [Flavisolibacter sp.]